MCSIDAQCTMQRHWWSCHVWTPVRRFWTKLSQTLQWKHIIIESLTVTVTTHWHDVSNQQTNSKILIHWQYNYIYYIYIYSGKLRPKTFNVIDFNHFFFAVIDWSLSGDQKHSMSLTLITFFCGHWLKSFGGPLIDMDLRNALYIDLVYRTLLHLTV